MRACLAGQAAELFLKRIGSTWLVQRDAASAAQVQHPFDHPHALQRHEQGQEVQVFAVADRARLQTHWDQALLARWFDQQGGFAAFHVNLHTRLIGLGIGAEPASALCVQGDRGAGDDRYACTVGELQFDLGGTHRVSRQSTNRGEPHAGQGTGCFDLDLHALAHIAKLVHGLQLEFVHASLQAHADVLLGDQAGAGHHGFFTDAVIGHQAAIELQTQRR